MPTDADRLLVRTLRDRRLLSETQIDHALEKQSQETSSKGIEPWLGTVLLELGLVTEDQLAETVAAGPGATLARENQRTAKTLLSSKALTPEKAQQALDLQQNSKVPQRLAEFLLAEGTVPPEQLKTAVRATGLGGGQFGRYFLLEELGRGGMGVIYKAWQPKLDRLTALKLLPTEASQDPEFIERFQREARALANLNHPNIVSIHDYGEENGQYYLVMEFVEGVNLRALMLERKLTPEEALNIVPQLCDALQYAHEQGVVHRDIKPENILLDKQGRVKITDFGLAKIVRGEKVGLPITRSGEVMGTPHYMAPEQIENPRKVDHRADIYSMGVVFYEMLTGELPMGRFEPPSKKVEVDIRIDEIVLRTLEKEPERRYQQVSEVKEEVTRIATTPAPHRIMSIRGKRRVLVGFAVGLLVGAVGVYWSYKKSPQPSAFETAQPQVAKAPPKVLREARKLFTNRRGEGSALQDVAYDAKRNRIIVSDQAIDGAYVISVETGEIVTHLELGKGPQGLEVINDKLYVTLTGDAGIRVVDLSTLQP